MVENEEIRRYAARDRVGFDHTGIANEHRPCDCAHARIERCLKADFRADARGIADWNRNDRLLMHRTYLTRAMRSASSRRILRLWRRPALGHVRAAVSRCEAIVVREACSGRSPAPSA